MHIKTIIVIVIIVLLSSCTDNFEKYNTDKTQLVELSTKELNSLFSRGQIQGCGWITTDDYNRMARTIVNHLCGYMCILDISYEQNEFRLGYHNASFSDIFVSAMPAIQSIFDLCKDDADYQNEYALALVWKVWMMHQTTDLWGPISYTYAGQGLETTPYESQKDVYYAMFADLKTATNIMSTSLANNSEENAFGSYDMIYNGDVEQWLKLANSLRLRLAIRISNVAPTKAQEEAEAAVAGETMTDTDDDAMLAVSGWTSLGNGLSRVNPWYSSLMSSSMESFMKGYNDPRMEQFFEVVNQSTTESTDIAELQANVGGYHGYANGFRTANEVTNAASFHSIMNTSRWSADTKLTYPLTIMYASETWFLKAEGAWRGWNMGETAQNLYEKGIQVSMQQWTDISSDSISNYINSINTPIAPNDYLYYHNAASDIPVKYSSDSEKQLEQIITQKWISMFPNSVEAFAEYRRTRYPKIYPKEVSANANIDLSMGQIITRLPFIEDEYSTNAEEVAKAIEMIGGKDLENIPLWWDTNTNGN